MQLIDRLSVSRVRQLLLQFPAVYINGPRRAGKTVLTRMLVDEISASSYTSMDRLSERLLAQQTPHQFIESLGRPAIVDEIQRVPELFLALKHAIDENNHACLQEQRSAHGQFLLTGSANLLATPALANAMVGRMATLTLLPLSAAECYGNPGTIIERLFSNDFSGYQSCSEPLASVMQRATFPDLSRLPPEEQPTWCDQYLEQITLHDPQNLVQIDKIESLPRLLRLLALRAGQLNPTSSLCQSLALTHTTVNHYQSILNNLFVTLPLQPWFHNLGKRLVKTPKVFFYDTVLLSHLLGGDLCLLQRNKPEVFGHCLENFVFTELLKSSYQHGIRCDFSFYRTHAGREVDLVLEHQGKVVGIEVKHRESITPKDLQGMKELKATAGNAFQTGIMFCQVPRVMPLGEGFWALPLAALWQF